VSLERIPDFVADAVQALPEAQRPRDIEALLCGYLGHLVETNEQINLVSRRNTMDHVERFTRECLFMARLLIEEWADLGRPARVLDIGSGGGFPGLVLKIAIPDLEIQMVEATRKKARFLAEVAAGLDLRTTSIVWGRAEDLADVQKLQYKRELRHAFDAVTGKGLGTLEASTALSLPFLRPGGAHWTFKGARYRDELTAAHGFFRQAGFTPERVERIPGDAESWVVCIRRLSRARSKSVG
jgi:16S rRNA (guanine527-N7)-methyltransferase